MSLTRDTCILLSELQINIYNNWSDRYIRFIQRLIADDQPFTVVGYAVGKGMFNVGILSFCTSAGMYRLKYQAHTLQTRCIYPVDAVQLTNTIG